MENIVILEKVLGNLPNTVILLTIASALWWYFKNNNLNSVKKYLDIYEQIGQKNEALIKELKQKLEDLEKEVAKYEILFKEIKKCAHIQSCPILKADEKQAKNSSTNHKREPRAFVKKS